MQDCPPTGKSTDQAHHNLVERIRHSLVNRAMGPAAFPNMKRSFINALPKSMYQSIECGGISRLMGIWIMHENRFITSSPFRPSNSGLPKGIHRRSFSPFILLHPNDFLRDFKAQGLNYQSHASDLVIFVSLKM
ncbi:hypothetical protein JTB14_001712 [Gonioctena quinquepunctata]|nr:hypothetical protein JTB14_001712 [Gonioctena quinquepunctata]